MIPIYNPPKEYLHATLSSVLAQNFPPDEMEICVVDDATSSGPPVGFIRALGGVRIAITRLPSNIGLAATWNRCIELARGKWVHILHQDDIVMPGFYSKLQELVTRYPQAGAAFTRHAFLRADGHWQGISELHQCDSGPLAEQRRKIFSLQVIHCPAIVVAAQTYHDLGGFDPQFKHALDWEMWMRIAAQRTILFEPALLAGYRVHAGSTTARQTENAENFSDIGAVIRHCSSYLSPTERGPITRRALAYYSEVAFGEGWQNIWKRKFDAATAQLGAAYALSPLLRQKSRIAYARLRLWEQRLRFGCDRP